MSTSDNLAVAVSQVTKKYGAQIILDDIDLEIRPGEFVVLLGPSGTGKTTLLRLLAGLESPDRGSVLVPPDRTTVFQEPRLIPAKRVLPNVIIGQRATQANKERGRAALAEVNLTGKERDWPATLSGGEAQRVALARALVREPQLLLLDEPFAALDALTRIRMQDLVGRLVTRHRPAVLLVTHDVDEAVRLADRVLILRDGKFVTDNVIGLARPRSVDDPRWLQYRADFLAELGVHASAS